MTTDPNIEIVARELCDKDLSITEATAHRMGVSLTSDEAANFPGWDNSNETRRDHFRIKARKVLAIRDRGDDQPVSFFSISWAQGSYFATYTLHETGEIVGYTSRNSVCIQTELFEASSKSILTEDDLLTYVREHVKQLRKLAADQHVRRRAM